MARLVSDELLRRIENDIADAVEALDVLENPVIEDLIAQLENTLREVRALLASPADKPDNDGGAHGE